MYDESEASPPVDSARLITTRQQVYFLLARRTTNTDALPSTIGELDVFDTEDEALDALDIHYAWCDARLDRTVVTTAQWYLQSAIVGPRLAPALGDVYLATRDDTGEHQAVAGGFLTEGEVIHWSAFVRAVEPFIPIADVGSDYGLAYRGDTTTRFGQLWFTPMRSRRVYPRRIVVDEDADRIG